MDTSSQRIDDNQEFQKGPDLLLVGFPCEPVRHISLIPVASLFAKEQDIGLGHGTIIWVDQSPQICEPRPRLAEPNTTS